MEDNNLQVSTGPKFNSLYVILPVLAIIGGLGFFLLNKKTVNPPSSGLPNGSPVASNSITMEEVGKHADQNSCWLVIEGNVYDVTSFIPNHPGEVAILSGCGKDATSMFNSRPGDGTSHSSRARNTLSDLQIGVLR